MTQAIEALEPRRLLAGLSDYLNNHLNNQLVHHLDDRPTPAWFADSPQAIINEHSHRDWIVPVFAPFVGPRDYHETDWIVQLNPEVTQRVRNLEEVDRLLSTASVEVQAVRGLGLPGLVQVRALARFETVVDLTFAADSHISQHSRNISVDGGLIPNDPEYGNQIALENIGQFGALPDADVDANLAWDTSTGSRRVVVGVIDSGIDLAHPDLYLNIWINQGEIAADKRALLLDTDQDGLITFADLNDPRNSVYTRDVNGNGYVDGRDLLADPRWSDGLDTDRNGFIDDFFGWNFRDALDEAFDPNDPTDTSGHGTHVAGIIGATGNNNLGVAGLNWRTSLMALKFLDRNNQGDVAAAIAAINYATMMRRDYQANVHVLNNSWGQSGSANPALNDALLAAQAADMLVVAAAGNGNALGAGVDNDRTPFYPANYPLENLLSVAASDAQDRLAAFSNYGATTVDLVAPGVGILSTLPGNRYGEANGTSMATPLVAGTAALIWSTLPQASASEVRQAILSSVDRLEGLSSLVATGGRLNSAQALASTVFAPTAELIQAEPVVSAGSFQHEVTVRFTDRSGMDVSTIGDGDIEVWHMWGSRERISARLKPNSISANATGTEVSATFLVSPPGGTWDALDFGRYEVRLNAGAVLSRIAQRPNRQMHLGQFRVQIEAPDVIYVQAVHDEADLTRDPLTLREAIATSNAAPHRHFTILLDTGQHALTRPYQADGNFAFAVAGLPTTCGSQAGPWSNGLWGDLDIFGQVTIVGDSSAQTSINSQTGDRVFKVHPGASLTLERLAVRGGTAPIGQSGGAILSAGSVELSQVLLEQNSVVSSMTSVARGGALAGWQGSLQVKQSRLTDNQADVGGGIFACGATSLSVTQSTVDANHGGGITSYANLDGVIENSTLASNFDGAVTALARDYPGGLGSSTAPRISHDGRYVSFLSAATNLVANDQNAAIDAYVLDRDSQSLAMVSVSTAGQAARSSVDGLVLSGDGRSVAFLTQANNLVSGDVGLSNDVFVRDLPAANTALISTGSSSRAARGVPSLSADGRFVAYQQTIAGDLFNTWAVYVADRQAATVQRIPLNLETGAVANIAFLDQTSISSDGRFVVLSARSSGTADRLCHEIYIYDRTSGTLRAIPRPTGSIPNGSMYAASISGDGRLVGFAADDTTLASGDTNGSTDIFVYDTSQNSLQRVSVTPQGTQANGHSESPAFSADGRFIAYSSRATNLTANDQNGVADIFVTHLPTLAVERVSVGLDGIDPNGASGQPALSADGRYVVFESSATNLVPSHPLHQRVPVDGQRQVYLRDRLANTNLSVSAYELPSTLRVSSSTLAFNAGPATVAGNVVIHNSLMAGNLVGFDLGAGTVSTGSNIYASASATSTVQATDRRNSTEATRLGPLASLNQLPPAYTLLQGNPAIDTGADQAIGTFDQWNRRRWLPDVGAVEAVDGAVAGRVFADLNGNRLRDNDEPGLSDQVVAIDFNDDGIPQADEPSRWTAVDSGNETANQAGKYQFEHLTPGKIVVRTVVPDQWQATGQPSTRATAGTVQGNAPSLTPMISASGQTLAFVSTATNLVPGDDAASSLFVFTPSTQSIEKVPVAGANLQVLDIVGSQDQLILFRNDTGVYVWNRQDRTLRAVSVNANGQLANAHSDHAAASSDGRWVAFSSFANNLAAGDADNFADLFLADLTGNVLISLSQTAVGVQGNNDSESPDISADGRIIAFVSDANNLVTGDTNNLGDIFVFDQSTRLIRRINVSETGQQSNGFSYPPQVSGNGRYVVFQSLATNLVPGDQNGLSDLFVVDLHDGSIERLDIPWLPPGQFVSVNPRISYDGQYVTFEATAAQLNHPDATSQRNVFVLDRSPSGGDLKSRLRLVSRNFAYAAGDGESRAAVVSADGQWIAFQSSAANIVAGDTNGVIDVFRQSNPFEDARRQVDLQVGQAITELDIGLQPLPGSISGTLFQDISQDGVYDRGDPTLSGWTVYLDSNANGRRDVDETFTVSRSDGTYQFVMVPAYREHVIAVDMPSNWEQLVPQPIVGRPRLFLPAGAQVSNRDFGFRPKVTIGQSENARIEGRVFQDSDSNGIQGGSEPPLADVEVYLDLNANERRDFGEPRTVTDSQGNYSFAGLGSRTYQVRIVPSEGMQLTSPLGNRFASSDQLLSGSSSILAKPQVITVADFDGQRGPDLAIALYSGNALLLKFNDGQGRFDSAPLLVPLAPAGQGPIAMAAGNVNRAGSNDLVVANSLNNTVSVLLDFGGTGFGIHRTINVGAKPINVALADLDADGDSDLVVTAQASNFLGQVRLFINDGTGQFSAGATLPSGGKGATSTAIGDFSGDGILDLAVANQGDFGMSADVGSIAILLGRGNAAFRNATTYSIGAAPMDVVAADLDGDGHLDLATVNFAVNTTSILRGNGQGGFQVLTEQWSVGQGPIQIESLDLEGDQDIDLLVTNLTGRSVSILRNRESQLVSPAISFEPAASFGVAEFSIGARLSFAVTDLDQSGTPDIAIINSETNSLKILNNTVVAGAHRLQSTGVGTSAGQNFGVRLTTLLPKLDALPGPILLTEDANPVTLSLTGIARGRSSGPPLRITASSSQTGLIANPQVQYVEGSATGQVILVPVPDANGQAIVSVEVRDAGADQRFDTSDDGVVSRSTTINVTPVNDPPTFRLSGNQVVTLGSSLRSVPAFAGSFDSGGGRDEDVQAIADYLISVDRPELFLVQPTIDLQGTLRYQPNLDTTGIATVTVRVKDNGGTEAGGIDRSTPASFQISVIDLADGDIDFGDAPSSYPVSLRANGARHRLSALYLGWAIDNEPDGAVSAAADGDDQQLDDEDGIGWFVPLIVSPNQPTQTSLRAQSSGSGRIDAWIDFNRDGDWSDTGEQILTSASVSAGENWLPFTVPPSLAAGETYARVRLSSVGGLSVSGLAEDGEVEDYRLTLWNTQSLPNAVVSVTDLPAYRLFVLNGQLTLQAAGQTLFSAPVSGVSAWMANSLNGTVVYAVTQPARNLMGSLEVSGTSVSLLVSSSLWNLNGLDTTAFAGVERVELIDAQPQQLILSAADIAKLNTQNRLELSLGVGDTLTTNQRWRIAARQLQPGGLAHTFQFSQQTLVIRTPAAWYNPLNAFDVNGDGIVTPLDALLVINYINRRVGSSAQLPGFDPTQPLNHGFYDVSGSNSIEPLDALLVINRINTQAAGEAEAVRKRVRGSVAADDD